MTVSLLQTRKAQLWAAVAVLAVVGALSAPLFKLGGFALDEGALLVYPELIKDGELPYKDFATLYGPGGPVLLAGVYTITGPTLEAERAVGLGYRLLVVAAIMAIALPAGFGAALGGGLLAGLLFMGMPLVASSSFGSLGLALLAVALAARGLREGVGARSAERWLAAAGLAAGYAVFIRFDFVPATILALLPLAVVAAPRGRLALLAGYMAGGVVPWLIVTALVGPGEIIDLIGDAKTGRDARELPLPPVRTADGAFLWAGILGGLAIAAAGGWQFWRTRTVEMATILGVGLMSLALVPYALGRADIGHVIVPAIPVLSLAPAFAVLLATRKGWALSPATMSLAVAVAIGIAAAGPTFQNVHDRLDLLLSPERGVVSSKLSVGDRSFLVNDTGNASEVQGITRRLKDMSKPGDSLFVGPANLRTAANNYAYIYHLLPELEHGSKFVELNPNLANADDSPLASELRKTDWILLTSDPIQPNEPNDSFRLGNPDPARVLRELYCSRLKVGQLELFRRCR